MRRPEMETEGHDDVERVGNEVKKMRWREKRDLPVPTSESLINASTPRSFMSRQVSLAAGI
jgi:hypothetical protein